MKSSGYKIQGPESFGNGHVRVIGQINLDISRDTKCYAPPRILCVFVERVKKKGPVCFWKPRRRQCQLRYVDDTFRAVYKDEIDDFHDRLDGQNAEIQFTIKRSKKMKDYFS